MQGYFQVPFCLCAAAFCFAEAIKNSSEVVHSYFFAAQRLVRWIQGANEEIRREDFDVEGSTHESVTDSSGYPAEAFAAVALWRSRNG